MYQNDAEYGGSIGDQALDEKINITHSQKFDFFDPPVSDLPGQAILTENIQVQNE